MKNPSCVLFFLFITICVAASSWSFEDGTVAIHNKKAGVGGSMKEKIVPDKRIGKVIQLGPQDSLKVLITTKDGKQASKPHQASLQLKDPDTKLETSFALQVKENGKGKLELTQKDIPVQLLAASKSLTASLIIASFGNSKPYFSPAFELSIDADPSIPLPSSDEQSEYKKLPEIHHIFKTDPQSPPRIITALFVFAVVACLPALLVVWISLGANLDHLSAALQSSPISHVLFFLSILALEGVFLLYYTHWKLFQALPSALGIGFVTFLSGSRALREVQQRRLAGLR